MEAPDEFAVDFPTLGFLAADWIEAHCIVPDGFHKGRPYVMADWQLWCTANFYRVRPDAAWDPEAPRVSTNFVYRRAQVVAPQKTGKGPWLAAIISLEAVGPTVFIGWAAAGDVYRCSDHGCACGWQYDYEAGEPMGMPRPTPLIQLTATAKDQTANVYRPLRAMFRSGWITDSSRIGEEFIRVGEDGRIDTVTSSAKARLGNPVTFVGQDEAMDLRTSLPTPTGWTTMGDVRAGDLLLGADGRPVRVIKATEVQHGRDCYRVTFTDGTSVVVSDGHLWQTRVSASAALPRVRTTGEMVADGRRFRVPAPAAYDLPAADLPVDPYFLGVWLGDGRTGGTEISCGAEDLADTRRLLAEVGVPTTATRWAGSAAHSLLFSAKVGYQGRGRPDVAKALQVLPCYREKHVPAAYLRGSREQREALLQGLMDSDGHVTETGFCTFAGNERLAADVVALLRTLGVHAQAVKRADPRARSGYGWKVNFTPRGGLAPFRLPRKVARVRQATATNEWVTIDSIEPVDSVPVRCVGVDSADHLFLAGEGGHVTHNTGIYTDSNGMVEVAQTQRRGLAGMDARSIETTNCWDPAERSVAQRTFESIAEDVFKFYRKPPANLSFRNKVERKRILEYVYAGSWWVNLEAIDAEASEILETDPANAERFFGNRLVPHSGVWLPDGLYDRAETGRRVEDGAIVCVGFDGSDSDDWTVLRAETIDGIAFTPRYGPDRRPTIWNPEEWGDSIPRSEVHAAVEEIHRRYVVVRMYGDPRDWQSEIGDWAAKHGEHVVEWATYRTTAMHEALIRAVVDLKSGRLLHDGCPITTTHVANARKKAMPGERYILAKPTQFQKIDAAMATVIAHEAAADAHASGEFERARNRLNRKIIVLR